MKQFFGLCMAVCVVGALTILALAIPPDHIKSETYVVMDAKTGQVLVQRDSDKRMYPASITKILTCALALEKGKSTDIVTMGHDAVYSIGRDTTHIALSEGEQISADALLAATMVESANDAANGLAEYVSGRVEDFPALMNETAARVGAKNSHFVNAHGLHDPDHYTTAYDMAAITRWAISIDGFLHYFGMEDYTIPPTNQQSKSRTFGTHDHMLVTSEYFYKGTLGGKLGWTPEAHHTLVTLAQRGDTELICVVMNTIDQWDKYKDTIALLDDCFENFALVTFEATRFDRPPVPLYDGDTQVGVVQIKAKDISITRPSSMAKADIRIEISLPERYTRGETVVIVARFLDKSGNEICRVPLDYELIASPEAKVAMTQTADNTPYRWLVPLIICGMVVLVIFVLFLVRAYNLYRWERRRREKREQLRRAYRLATDCVVSPAVDKPHSGSKAPSQRRAKR